jgi:amino acid permease
VAKEFQINSAQGFKEKYRPVRKLIITGPSSKRSMAISWEFWQYTVLGSKGFTGFLRVLISNVDILLAQVKSLLIDSWKMSHSLDA